MLHYSLYFVAYLLLYALIAAIVGGLGVLVAVLCGTRKSRGFRVSAITVLVGALFGVYSASMTPANNQYVFVQLTACLLLLAIALCLPWRRSSVRLLFASGEGKHCP